MAEHQIRWKQGDYIRLGRAVADFNRKINKLQAEENRLYLPELENYQELRDRITTRRELNRMINSLRAFQKEGAEDLYTFESGQQVTKWEYKELTKLGKKATKTLQQKISEFHEPFTPSGFTKAQMGNSELASLEDTLKSIGKLSVSAGADFKRIASRIRNIGSNDYEMRKARVYRDNIMQELKNLSLQDKDFEKLYNHFNKIKNPVSFYENMQKSNAMQDFFEWYKNPEAYGGFASSDELIDYIIKEYE